MLPSGDNPLELEPSFQKPPFQLYDQIQNPIIDDSPFFSNFPSPFSDEHQIIFPDFFAEPPLPSSDHHPQKKPPNPKQKQAIPRKRTGKKDRHSKISTAKGIRDRRMRLSLQVARKFFDLQDMLGYDKASKTIEWLFSKSNKAMKDLTNTKSESFSGENCLKNEGLAEGNETREKALCRTEEKGMVKRVETSPNQNVVEKLGSSTSSPPLDRERVCVGDCAPLLQLQDVGTIEKLLGNSTSDQCNCSSFMGFLGNWDLFEQ